ncbi:hypothetical protein SPRG_10734 [Saprolegnia parasitica CBS 223.65]|uniref:ZZ-type domain-containing protein n=1 Tax=Saprolegnia parasitica (strain CBS 223.65) TaxID=695850 RepID=A0A067C9P3_SAPPC|nr:hypothetical protein SPRG_10734 [Saprolegnia parasitica CBS 223.65]KDO23542.1 hypothetical protein SPRG_10734 [Saprolegnia parasitica CBS 223.65]|eukprot:XP_012205692.1 hypothetical protein SPRG_10734 [Saprolegnia parasitica CBS 223.65]
MTHTSVAPQPVDNQGAKACAQSPEDGNQVMGATYVEPSPSAESCFPLDVVSIVTQWYSLTHAAPVWKNLCLLAWPSLAHPLPQLPGAPEYDVIRLYRGSWRQCFLERHAKNQHGSIRVAIPDFAHCGADRIVTDTFMINDHRFCLWIFPRGNPHEPEYASRSISVYLVVTELEKRPPSWLTCAVFSLCIEHATDPSKHIFWHASLHDNRFDTTLFNWGVHALGDLETLKSPSGGYLSSSGVLCVAARVRLMSMTLRLYREPDLAVYRGRGLLPKAASTVVEVPFCTSLEELHALVRQKWPDLPLGCTLWSYSQSVLTGQTMRPRKCLQPSPVSPSRHSPLFGHQLIDGVDIDAYSSCQLLVDPQGLSGDVLFVKVFHAERNELEYVGRVLLANCPTPAAFRGHLASTSGVYHAFTEEIAPLLVSEPLAADRLFSASDIVILVPEVRTTSIALSRLRQYLQRDLDQVYAEAQAMAINPLYMPTLHDLETLGEALDIPRFRIHSAHVKCLEDAKQTLRYIMEGRHLGFICDACGVTDFSGPRYNCRVCSDYDLCAACAEALPPRGAGDESRP